MGDVAYKRRDLWYADAFMPLTNLFLFTGENAFALRQEKMSWIQAFLEKHGSENLVRIEGRELAMRTLLDEVSVAPFIASKRLVIVEGIPECSGEQMESLCYVLHPQVVLLFIEPKTDRRLGSVKVLLTQASQKTFPLLREVKLWAWVNTLFVQQGCSIERCALDVFIKKIGENQDMLFQESLKLMLFVNGNRVCTEDVERIVVPSDEGVIWTMTDLIAGGRTTDAVLYVQELIDRGHDPFELWNIYLWMLRNMVLVRGAYEGGAERPDQITRETEVPFPSVRGLLPFVRRLDRSSMERIIDCAVRADTGLKTGAYRVTGEEPQELLALLDRCVARIREEF